MLPVDEAHQAGELRKHDMNKSIRSPMIPGRAHTTMELMMASHITRRTRRAARRQILHHGLPPVVTRVTVELPHEAVPRPRVPADEVPAHLSVAVHVDDALGAADVLAAVPNGLREVRVPVPPPVLLVVGEPLDDLVGLRSNAPAARAAVLRQILPLVGRVVADAVLLASGEEFVGVRLCVGLEPLAPLEAIVRPGLPPQEGVVRGAEGVPLAVPLAGPAGIAPRVPILPAEVVGVPPLAVPLGHFPDPVVAKRDLVDLLGAEAPPLEELLAVD
mmetsp:Transcript_16061/g.37075  ORF Transcript_16061/g.37075 Transcript_16061/m.37075 type:complete len:274 (-) Transcript_16061:19-840(-)